MIYLGDSAVNKAQGIFLQIFSPFISTLSCSCQTLRTGRQNPGGSPDEPIGKGNVDRG